MSIAVYAKAIVGAIVGGLGVAYTALDDDVWSTQDSILVASTVVAALGLIWAVPNKDPNRL